MWSKPDGDHKLYLIIEQSKWKQRLPNMAKLKMLYAIPWKDEYDP
jgi:hypothetical protein